MVIEIIERSFETRYRRCEKPIYGGLKLTVVNPREDCDGFEQRVFYLGHCMRFWGEWSAEDEEADDKL